MAHELERQGVEVYCPLIKEVRQWSDRKKKVINPLFKSYVFVKLPEKERNQVFDVPGVVRYLFWLGKPAVIREEEIDTIKEWLLDERVESVEVHDLNPGDEMTIPRGSFKGQKAVISKVEKNRLQLILRELGATVHVKINDPL